MKFPYTHTWFYLMFLWSDAVQFDTYNITYIISIWKHVCTSLTLWHHNQLRSQPWASRQPTNLKPQASLYWESAFQLRRKNLFVRTNSVAMNNSYIFSVVDSGFFLFFLLFLIVLLLRIFSLIIIQSRAFLNVLKDAWRGTLIEVL